MSEIFRNTYGIFIVHVFNNIEQIGHCFKVLP